MQHAVTSRNSFFLINIEPDELEIRERASQFCKIQLYYIRRKRGMVKKISLGSPNPYVHTYKYSFSKTPKNCSGDHDWCSFHGSGCGSYHNEHPNSIVFLRNCANNEDGHLDEVTVVVSVGSEGEVTEEGQTILPGLV